MTMRWLFIAFATLGVAGLVFAEPAEAARKKRYKATQRIACADTPASFSWRGVWFNGKPRPNGCAPAIIENGEFIGQDPDPRIRAALRRSPTTGYTQYR